MSGITEEAASPISGSKDGDEMKTTRATLHMDPTDRILLKRNLDKNGKGQKFFTHEVRRHCDPYVPMRSGILKNTSVERVRYIEYIQPYARRQYYENAGARKQGTTKHNTQHLRGKMWDRRMWADRGKEIVRSVANYCGGKAKK